MRVETYFEQIVNSIENCPVVLTSRVTCEKRADHEGFISGEIGLIDGSILMFREFVDVEDAPERLMYVYQDLNGEGNLIFRYDNTGHHRQLNLPTYPNHKHDGDESRVIPSDVPSFVDVLEEIERLVILQ